MIPFVLRFQPILLSKIWGEESWEVSDFSPHLSVALNGEAKGKTLRELYELDCDFVLGSAFQKQTFPLLIKTIKTTDKLSVQVHPNDQYALEKDPESQGKREAWIILNAKPESRLVIGFEHQLSREEVLEKIKSKTLEQILRKWELKPGDAFYLEPGTIHAIGSDIELLEIQQSSDSTYRVYDYARVDATGNHRELHIEKGLDVLNYKASDSSEHLKPVNLQMAPFERSRLQLNESFCMEDWNFYQGQFATFYPPMDPVTFGVFYVKRGSLFFPETGEIFRKGQTFFLTAAGFARKLRPFIESKTELIFSGPGLNAVTYHPTLG